MVQLIDEIIYFPTDSKSLLFFTQDQYMIEELQQQKHIFRSNLHESNANTWRNKQANKVSLLVHSTVMQTTQLLFWKFLMSTQYIKIEQSEYNMIHTVCIYGSSVSLHFTTSSLARRYAFFRCDLLGSTTFIKIISSSSFDTISDSVMSGHSTSSMKLLTFPECSSL